MDSQSNYSSLGPGFEPEASHGRIPVWVVLFVSVSLLLAVISMLRFPKVFSEYRFYIKAEQRMKNGETSQALSDLMMVVEAHPDSVPMVTKLIDLSMEAGYFELAAYVFDGYLVGKDLTDSQYSRMMGYSGRLETYFSTYEIVEQLLTKSSETEAATEEEAAAVRADVREHLSSLLEDPDTDQTMLFYFMALFSENTQERYEWLQKGYQTNPEYFDLRVQLGNTSRTLGKLDEADRYLNEAYAKDHADSGALRGMAVLSLLKGDPASALSQAEEAYALYPEGDYVMDTYLIALHVNGQTKEEGYIRAEIENAQGALDEDTKRFLDGECTLQEYYME